MHTMTALCIRFGSEGEHFAEEWSINMGGFEKV